MEDFTTQELLEELANRFETLIVAGTLDSQLMTFLDGNTSDLCIINTHVGYAIVSQGETNENDSDYN